jgi:hypothetical protein
MLRGSAVDVGEQADIGAAELVERLGAGVEACQGERGVAGGEA